MLSCEKSNFFFSELQREQKQVDDPKKFFAERSLTELMTS